MGTYFRRAVKYFIQLVVLFVILFSFMFLTGTVADSGGSVSHILLSQRGLLLGLAVVVLSLLYPRFGFVNRQVNLADRERIIKAFAISGYELDPLQPCDDEMIFRADNMAKRIMTLWEDRIVVSLQNDCITVSGIRKEVVRIEFRLKSFIQNNENK